MENFNLPHHMLLTMVQGLARKLKVDFSAKIAVQDHLKIVPVTKDTTPLLYMLGNFLPIQMVEHPNEADVAIDLVFDGGNNCRAFSAQFENRIPFYVLVDKAHEPNDFANKWIVFPWETEPVHTLSKADEILHDEMMKEIADSFVQPEPIPDHIGMSAAYDHLNEEAKTSIKKEVIYDLIRQVMELNPHRPGLKDTPARVIKAWKHWTSGYHVDIAALLKVFEDGAENYDQMVIVKDIPIYSKCEHHLADIFGTCTIAYIPNGKIVGLSKLSRLADAFSRRLQVQERLTCQIADAINDNLSPKGVGVIIKARHMCMESRGICQQGHHTITSALRGCIQDESSARAEFLRLA